MASRGRELKVYLTSDVSKFGKGLKAAEAPLSRFKKLAIGALTGVAAAAGAMAIKFGKDSVEAFIEDDAAAAKLAKTLENLGLQMETTDVEAYIAKLQQATGVTDGELRPAFEKLVLAVGDTDTAMKLLEASTDAAAGTGKDLDTIVTALAKSAAAGGSLGPLSRLIPGLDKTIVKGGDAASILSALNAKFSGQAATRAATYAGQMQSLGTAFGEVQEAFGRGLLSNMEDTDGQLSSMDDTMYTLAPMVEQFGANIAALATDMGRLAGEMGPVVNLLQQIDQLRNAEGLLRILTLGNLGDFGYIAEGIDRLNGDTGGGPLVDTGGGQLPSRPASSPTGSWGDFYSQGGTPRSADPNRYRARADDADARAAARGTKTRSAPSAS